MSNQPVIVTLHGSNRIECDEFGLKIERKRHGLVDEMARLLVDHNVDPLRRLQVLRNGTKVFARDRSIAAWASIRLVESDTWGFRKSKYKKNPFVKS